MFRRPGFRPLEQGEGDSLVAAFPHASDAAAATLQAQRDLLAEDWPAGADVAVRMALHTGEARLRDDLYYAGPSIIRCARLRALVHPGLPTSFPPLPTVDGKPTNVPIQLTSFIGRRAELDELTDLITRHPLVTVVGGADSARPGWPAQAAGEIAIAFADGVWRAAGAAGARQLRTRARRRGTASPR